MPSDGLPAQSYDQISNRINTSGYQYDLAGNLTRGRDASGNWRRYQYDSAGHLVNINDDNGNNLQGNGYTSSRQRLVKNEPNADVLTWYVWGGESVIAEYKSLPDYILIFTYQMTRSVIA